MPQFSAIIHPNLSKWTTYCETIGTQRATNQQPNQSIQPTIDYPVTTTPTLSDINSIAEAIVATISSTQHGPFEAASTSPIFSSHNTANQSTHRSTS
jgi:hypothetical protein